MIVIDLDSAIELQTKIYEVLDRLKVFMESINDYEFSEELMEHVRCFKEHGVGYIPNQPLRVLRTNIGEIHRNLGATVLATAPCEGQEIYALIVPDNSDARLNATLTNATREFRYADGLVDHLRTALLELEHDINYIPTDAMIGVDSKIYRLLKQCTDEELETRLSQINPDTATPEIPRYACGGFKRGEIQVIAGGNP